MLNSLHAGYFFMLFMHLLLSVDFFKIKLPGFVAQSVACLTADPGVRSLILARSNTFVEIDHEIISTIILLPSLIQEGLMSTTSKCMYIKYWSTA